MYVIISLIIYALLYRGLVYFVSVVLLLILIILDCFVHYHQEKRQNEARIQKLLSTELSTAYEDFRFPESGTFDSVRVYRDSKLVTLCSNLLVPGDLLLLKKNEKIRFKVSLSQSRDGPFVLEEFPISKSLEASLSIQRPESYFTIKFLQLKKAQNILLYVFCCVSVICFVLRRLILGVWDFQWSLILLPFLFMQLSIPWNLVSLYCNSRIILLFESLKTSKEAYSEDLDEFDEEAPPPTKNIRLPGVSLLKEMAKGTRDENLFDVLGHLTVFCYVDKELVITEQYPSIEQVLVFEQDELLKLDIASVIGHSSIRFQDMDWKKYSDHLRPLGLATLLMTNCKYSKNNHVMQGHLTNTLWKYGSTCNCQLGREIGFSSEIRKRYKLKREKVGVFSFQREFYDPVTQFSQEMFAMSDSKLVDCVYVWTGNEMCLISDTMRLKIEKYIQNAKAEDMTPILYAYKPQINQRGLILLGIVVSRYEPQPDLCDFVDDLKQAGIRFVHFTEKEEQPAKSFADRLGLETDWNSCILLNPKAANYTQISDIKARLPRGIQNIRSHIKEVDDIPLLVSLFADCVGDNALEMIEIFQDYGEVVCCVGSSLNDNMKVFTRANVSIGNEPNASKSLLKSASDLNTFSCSLNMMFDQSPYIILETVREARNLCHNFIQATFFMFSSLTLVGVIFGLSGFLMLPAFEMGYFILIVFVSTLLAVSMLMSPYEEDILKIMTGKNLPVEHFSVFVFYFCATVLPSVFICLFCSVAVVASNLSLSSTQLIANLFQKTTLTADSILLYQRTLTFCIMTCILVHSVSSIHRNQFITKYNPLRNKFWTLLLCFGGFICSWFVFMIRNVWLCVLLVWIPVQFGINEFIKSRDYSEFQRFQKRSKLEFNTKLGMHSPI